MQHYLYRLLMYSPFRGKLKPEYKIQYQFVSLCRTWSVSGQLQAVWSSTPNEIANNKNPAFGAMLRALGKIKGAPDMKFMWSTGSGCLEFKAGKGKLTDEQLWYKQWCTDRQVHYREVRSVIDATQALVEWGVLPEVELKHVQRSFGESSFHQAH